MDDDIEAIWTPPEVSEHRPVTWIRPFAPIIFLYPSVLVSASFVPLSMMWPSALETQWMLGRIFICLMALNLSVLAVKYSGPSLTLIMVLALWALFVFPVEMPEGFNGYPAGTYASPLFFLYWSLALSLLMAVAWFQARNRAWEIIGTDLVCRSVFGRSVRYSVVGLSLQSRAHDVVKHLLLKTGDIYISTEDGRLLMVAQNVIGYREREQQFREQLVLAQAQEAAARRQLQQRRIHSDQHAD